MWFRDKYAFLSNMYEASITVNGIEYTCVEAAFQSFKTADRSARVNFSGIDGKTAKKMGRVVALRSDWEKIKEDVMLRLLLKKFAIPELRDKLLATVPDVEYICEENSWGDTYWGVDEKQGGKNRLGHLLMQVRDKFCKELVDRVISKKLSDKHFLCKAVGKSELSRGEVEAFIISAGLPVYFRFGFAAYGARENESTPWKAVRELRDNVGDVYLLDNAIHVNCFSGSDMW